MNAPFKEQALWIDREDALEHMLADISRQERIAVDTESNSLYAYQEHVCLIQISTGKQDYLVDPLADINLQGLGKITADAGIEKIFHAAEYDVICLRRDFDFAFRNLFDTMHAARILGFEKVGLSDILEKQFGVMQGRSYQKADWSKRPLKEEMKTYARFDTHYLIPLRNRLEKILEAQHLKSLAVEDFALLCLAQAEENHRPLYAQVSGYHKLDPKELRVLDELCQYRDKAARRMDRPLFKVISSHVLLQAAREQPGTLAELQSLKGVSKRIAQHHGDGLLEAIQRGQDKPPLELKQRPAPSRAYIHRLESLHDWRKNTACKLKVQSDIVLPRSIMEKIAAKAPQQLTALRAEMEAVPWRFEKFGSEILTVLKKGC